MKTSAWKLFQARGNANLLIDCKSALEFRHADKLSFAQKADRLPDGGLVPHDDWSRERSEWCGRKKVANGILRKAVRGKKLKDSDVRLNRLFSSIRCKIEKVFGWWKRSAGYRRVRYVGRVANRLELEFKCVCWNLKRLANLSAA